MHAHFFQFVSKGHNHSPHVVSPGLIPKLLPIILLSSYLLFFWLFSPLMSIPSLLSPCLSQWEQLLLLLLLLPLYHFYLLAASLSSPGTSPVFASSAAFFNPPSPDQLMILFH